MLHDLIGQHIEHAYSKSIDQYVDLLAFHFDRSQNEAKRREYLYKAGNAPSTIMPMPPRLIITSAYYHWCLKKKRLQFSLN